MSFESFIKKYKGDEMIEEITVEAQPEVQPEKKIYKCVNCEKTSDKGFFLLNTPEFTWEFEGEAICFECYIRLMVKKALKEQM